MTSRALISKIHCTLSANQKRVRVSSMYNNSSYLQGFTEKCQGEWAPWINYHYYALYPLHCISSNRVETTFI